MKLKYSYSDLEIEKVKPLPMKFREGERVNVEVKAQGWFPNQVIAVAKNRSLIITNCIAQVGRTIKVKVIETKNNIYLAEPLKQRIRI